MNFNALTSRNETFEEIAHMYFGNVLKDADKYLIGVEHVLTNDENVVHIVIRPKEEFDNGEQLGGQVIGVKGKRFSKEGYLHIVESLRDKSNDFFGESRSTNTSKDVLPLKQLGEDFKLAATVIKRYNAESLHGRNIIDTGKGLENLFFNMMKNSGQIPGRDQGDVYTPRLRVVIKYIDSQSKQ